jgi:hypothetical protein
MSRYIICNFYVTVMKNNQYKILKRFSRLKPILKFKLNSNYRYLQTAIINLKIN